ncbi:MAG TPA: hypothetical protein VKX25_03405 [Bryobacteraceae bacterium]|jgi:hypothetical protein|nr:hypothetical protein [Bryobacteraceae bacterium]
MKIAAMLALLALGSGMVRAHEHDWPVREQQTIEKTLPLEGAPMRVVVDNVEGYVHLRAVEGSNVHVVAHKIVRAETESDVADSKEVQLAAESRPGTVSVYYDAPWRCRGYGDCHDNRRRFYEVRFDIDVEVPRTARIVASTVNGGDLTVDGGGDFEVSNVNGGIRMTGITGSGEVHTVNGPIAVHFAKNPRDRCDFKTVNGGIDVYFVQPLSADLRFKTFHGEIYSDFDVSARAIPAEVTERHNGKYVYHSDRASGARAGEGGPELSFDTLNGSIRLHRER